MRAMVLGLLGWTLAFGPALATEQAGLFDPPSSTQTAPSPSGQLRCSWYADLMVRETGTDTPAPGPAAVMPAADGARQACAPAPASREITLDTGGFSFLGRKGGYLVFAATDPNGAVPFKVLAAATGRVIYSDGTAADRGIQSLGLENGGLHLRYTRGLNAPCSILKDSGGCWSTLISQGKIARALAHSAPAPQMCAAAYQTSNAPTDDPSIVTYDVDMTIDAAGRTQVISRGAVGCAALP